MKLRLAVGVIVAALVCISFAAGCKKRYIPRVTEEIIDPGVQVHSEPVVE